MSNEKPSTWQQCRAIAEAAMRPPDFEEAARATRKKLLDQLAAGSEQGAKLAARLADANGPIEVAHGDTPPEFFQFLSKTHLDAGSAAALPHDLRAGRKNDATSEVRTK